ncbi:Cyclopropane-fatty-acyl-phospholipid synthase [Salinisphaera sp. PC39]|uniref:cyclopropane-fatty-acyl-phospholipid synthase family protein n=1 Tax=Salinisphaera sp. PC39 TaxID=1304156 RepID=UPI0033418506
MSWSLLERWIRTGTLHVHMPDGEVHRVGEGAPEAHVHLRSRAVLGRLLRDPDMAVGEAYMDGDWWPGEGGLLPVFELYFRNRGDFGGSRLRSWLRAALWFLREANGRLRARRNVQHHYDLDAELFRRFLDEDLHYSCAYFEREDMSLEAAQRAKCRHIAGKLCLSPGERVLDIGCGWGGMAFHLARNHGVEVTGLTLSQDQYDEARRRARDLGLDDRVRFRLQDYREHDGDYDAVVSVGMFEHVGRPQYQTFFDSVHGLLAPRGRALIHTIGRSGPPADSQSWIQRHIFPGGYIPSLSETARPIEHSGLVLSDLEIWRKHYARTLAAWNQRFQATRSEFAERLGERFCRMWEFYLIGCRAIFEWGDLVVFQFQLALDNDTVPLTRDYLYPPDRTDDREDTGQAA